MLIKNELKQCGFTLVELMVGLAVSSIVIAGVAFSWGIAIQNNAYILSVSAINNDLRAASQIMSQDIRRATSNDNTPAVLINADGNCIVFNAHISPQNVGAFEPITLDSDRPTLTPSGYRLTDEGTLQIWISDATVDPDDNLIPATSAALTDCDGSSTEWRDFLVAGDRGITITALSFDTGGSWCLNINTPGTAYGSNTDDLCETITTTGNQYIELVRVNIAMNGQVVAGRNTHSFSFTDSVKVRNDRIVSN